MMLVSFLYIYSFHLQLNRVHMSTTSNPSVFLYRQKKTTSPIPAFMRSQARLDLYIKKGLIGEVFVEF